MRYVIEGIVDDEVNKSILYGARSLKAFKEMLKLYEKIKIKQQKERRENKDKPFKTNGNAKTRQNNQEDVRCFNCGRKGHLSKNCNDKEKGSKCCKCNKYEHIAYQCNAENKRNEDDQGRAKRSYVVQETNAEMPGYK
ncbi:protein lin-28 homolog A-like [Onthophagus taurus]|uniref:protein lin-28 homolog A-like n=1 Tax=Onthophagus taurus TaxID=166361 RepID=UPI0039BE276C